MGLADNYLLQNKDPTDAFFSGIQKYQTMQNNDIINQTNQRALNVQDQADLRNQQAIADLQGLDHTNATALQQYNLKYGDLPVAKNAQAAFSQLQAKEQQNMLGEMSKNISLFSNGRGDLVINNARAKAAAYQQAGNATKAKEYNDFADFAASDSSAAHKALLMTYASVSGDKTGGNFKAYGEAMGPKVETTDGGDAIYRGSYDPITGEPITDPTMIVKKGNTPDAVLKANTDIKTTRMNNTSSENVATISGNASNKNAIIAAAASNYTTDQNNATKRLELNQDGQIKWYNAQTERQNANTNQVKAQNTTNKQQQQETQRIQKLDATLPEIERLLTSGNATGSGIGNVLDQGASMIGISTKGAETTAQLQTLAGQIVALMPRMEGPQSDKDVAMYKEMAGNLADPSKPVATRLAALRMIKQLNTKYRVLNTQNQANGGGQANHSDLFN